MSNDETYNGWANRETWAFNLHWQNDQGLYIHVIAHAHDYIAGQMSNDPEREVSDRELGEAVVERVQEVAEEVLGDESPYPLDSEPVRFWRMVLTEVGSWWRVDHAEVGAAVRESLDNER